MSILRNRFRPTLEALDDRCLMSANPIAVTMPLSSTGTAQASSVTQVVQSPLPHSGPALGANNSRTWDNSFQGGGGGPTAGSNGWVGPNPSSGFQVRDENFGLLGECDYHMTPQCTANIIWALNTAQTPAAKAAAISNVILYPSAPSGLVNAIAALDVDTLENAAAAGGSNGVYLQLWCNSWATVSTMG